MCLISSHFVQKLQDEAFSTRFKDGALEKILAAAELSMQALKITDDIALKKDLNVNIKQLLSDAEKIKASPDWKPTAFAGVEPNAKESSSVIPKIKRLKHPVSSRQLPTAEKIIILKASTLNGYKFPPWQQDPSLSEFELDESSLPFTYATNSDTYLHILTRPASHRH